MDSKKMHICFITHEYPKAGYPHGGIGSFVKTLSTVLTSHNIQVSVVGINYTAHYEAIQEDGVCIYRLPKSIQKGLSWILNARAINQKIRQIHKQHPIDIVETAELGLAFLSKIKGVKYIIRLHGGHHFFAEAENRGIHWWKGYQEKKSFAKADAFIAVSKYVKQHTESYLSFNNKPIAYIHNPIATQVYQPQAIAKQKGRIVFAGTLCEKKGVRQLIQAFALVKEKNPDATLHLYGRDWRFPNGRSYLQEMQTVELPLLADKADAVFFHGPVSREQLVQEYARAEVCVFPSHMETLGLVAPEAMAVGKPVVFTKLGPGPEIITDGVTGLLCDPLNPDEIAEKMLWVLGNEVAASEMGKKAAKDAQNRFSVETLLSENIDFFMTLVNKKK